MAKTAAERQRERREKLKSKGEYDEYKRKQSEKKGLLRQGKRDKETEEEKRHRQEKDKLNHRNFRQRLKHNVSEIKSPFKAFGSRQALGKAMAKVKRHLPKSPRKRNLVVRKLADSFSPINSAKSNYQRSNAINEETRELVITYYNNDNVSTQAPGIRDFHIVRENNTKTKIQKRYLQLTIGEAHQSFLEEHPTIKIGLTKFTLLRPKHVCLRSKTPDNMCLCTYHENIRLILVSLTVLPNNTRELVKMIVCNDESEKCMLQECNICKDLNLFKKFVATIPPDILEEDITYKQWTKSEDNHISRNTKRAILNEVLDVLQNQLVYFLWHVYIKRTQAQYFDNMKRNLSFGKLLIQIDFSENYSHSYQDEIQSAHWENASFTLYTAMIYYSQENVVKSEPYVVISDYLNHDKYAVVMFNNLIIESFKRKHPNYLINSIEYQSDGTSQHFKQKFTIFEITLSSIPTNWNFSATSHGKGCIDGIGGTVKRRIREANKARKIDPTTSIAFATAATKICPNINILHAKSEDVEDNKKLLDKTWKPVTGLIHSIPGTRKMHCFRSIQPGVVQCSITSNSEEKQEFNFYCGVLKKVNYNEENSEQPVATILNNNVGVGQWVRVKYDDDKFYGIVIESYTDQHRVKCLIPTSTPGLFKFENEHNAVFYTDDKIEKNVEIPTLINSRGYYKM